MAKSFLMQTKIYVLIMAGLNDHILLEIKIHIIGTNFLRNQTNLPRCSRILSERKGENIDEKT